MTKYGSVELKLLKSSVQNVDKGMPSIMLTAKKRSRIAPLAKKIRSSETALSLSLARSLSLSIYNISLDGVISQKLQS